MAFIQPLVRLIEQALQSQLNSYIPLVPLIAAYLLYVRRPALARPYRTSIAGALILSCIAVAALGAELVWHERLTINDGLVLTTLAYVSIIAAGGFLFLGETWMAAAAFPMGFLIFMVPLPDAAVGALESLSVLASTQVAAFFFRMTGTPTVRDGAVFMLPGIVIEVAQECSGIRSSWVLFITSLVAAHLLLATTWRRLILVAFVIPLGIVRNGFRILVIGLLGIYVGPQMLDSPIHHQGGPLFFLLSLVPLYTLLWWLRRSER
jgi:exosortase C (VPDSG-CTERM-specific)